MQEGYATVYNPGGPGMAPTPGVRYSTPSPPQARAGAAAVGSGGWQPGPSAACQRALPRPWNALQTVQIWHTIDSPLTVTWCRYNGTVTRDPVVCSKAVGAPLPFGGQ